MKTYEEIEKEIIDSHVQAMIEDRPGTRGKLGAKAWEVWDTVGKTKPHAVILPPDENGVVYSQLQKIVDGETIVINRKELSPSRVDMLHNGLQAGASVKVELDESLDPWAVVVE